MTVKPRDIVTQDSLNNAMVLDMATSWRAMAEVVDELAAPIGGGEGPDSVADLQRSTAASPMWISPSCGGSV